MNLSVILIGSIGDRILAFMTVVTPLFRVQSGLY